MKIINEIFLSRNLYLGFNDAFFANLDTISVFNNYNTKLLKFLFLQT